MSATTYPSQATVSSSTWTLRAGYVISALTALFLLFDGVIHVLAVDPVVDSMRALGFPASAAVCWNSSA